VRHYCAVDAAEFHRRTGRPISLLSSFDQHLANIDLSTCGRTKTACLAPRNPPECSSSILYTLQNCATVLASFSAITTSTTLLLPRHSQTLRPGRAVGEPVEQRKLWDFADPAHVPLDRPDAAGCVRAHRGLEHKYGRKHNGVVPDDVHL